MAIKSRVPLLPLSSPDHQPHVLLLLSNFLVSVRQSDGTLPSGRTLRHTVMRDAEKQKGALVRVHHARGAPVKADHGGR